MNLVKTKPNTGKRIGATLIDYGIIWTFFFLYVVTFGELNDGGAYTVNGIPALVPVAFWFCYLVLVESWISGSLGHKLLGLEVVTLNKSKPTFSQILVRRICDILDIQAFLGLLAFILVLSTPSNQRLGDILAKTIVIDTKDPEQTDMEFEFERTD